MNSKFPELDRIRVTVGDDVRERQLASIGDAIRSARRPGARRFRLLAVAAALILAVPVMALASEDAVPGDVLYPIKRMLEPVVSLMDGDVEVDHRVREAEILLDRNAEPQTILDQVDRARIVVTDQHPDHLARLDVIVDELESRHERDAADRAAPPEDGSDEDSAGRDAGDRAPDHGPAATDSSEDTVDGHDQSHGTTTTVPADTTTTPRDGERDG